MRNMASTFDEPMEQTTTVTTTVTVSTEEIKKQIDPLRSSTMNQPQEVKEYLAKLVQADPYNKFCVDCLHN